MPVFNKFVIKDFTKERYLSLVRAHPKLGEEKTQIYLMLILTFLSLSFLGIFAINPTLTTIVELNRKLEDSKFVNEALKTKTANLSSLTTQYQALNNTWPIVNAAVPSNPQVTVLIGQLKTLAQDNNVQLVDLQSYEVELANSLTKENPFPKQASYVLSMTAEGTDQSLLAFTKAVSNFNRVLTVEEINFTNEEKLSVTIRARAFFIL